MEHTDSLQSGCYASGLPNILLPHSDCREKQNRKYIVPSAVDTVFLCQYSEGLGSEEDSKTVLSFKKRRCLTSASFHCH